LNVSEGSPDLEPLQPTVSEKKPEREGLPSGYRMRADAHYVDQLAGRRGERVYSDQSRTAASFDADAPEPAPRDRRDVRERRSDRVLAHIAEEVSAIEAAGALWRNPGQSQRRLAADLLQVHTGRAAWLSGANTLLEGSPRGTITGKAIGALLLQVRESLATECRMAGVALHLDVDDWNARGLVYETEFKLGVAGAIRALLAALPDVESAVIRMNATVTDEALQVIEISQDVVQMPAASGRFFDLTWTDRPGGWMAAFAASVARAFVQRDGGSAVFVPGDRRGGTIRLVLPPIN
jgi:hypothetical protein